MLRDLWGTGQSDLKGDFFQMDDCRLSPRPQADMKIICAGQSAAGMAFTATYADYNFCFGKGVNTPTAFAPTVARLEEAKARTGRDVSSYVLFMVIADETDAAAQAKWEHYKAGADEEAIAWLGVQGAADTNPAATPMSARWSIRPQPLTSTWARWSARSRPSRACSTR